MSEKEYSNYMRDKTAVTKYGHENEMYNVGLNLKEVERL